MSHPEHGNTIVRTVACGVHPLHVVKVRANGSRSGCPMCEAKIEDVCRHGPVISQDQTRVIGCTCGWRVPSGVTDSDDASSEHFAISMILQRTSKERPVSLCNGVKVFCATMIQQRQALGEQVTAWIEAARRQRPGFQVVDIVMRQSSDEAFHCISCIIFFNEDVPGAKEKKRRG